MVSKVLPTNKVKNMRTYTRKQRVRRRKWQLESCGQLLQWITEFCSAPLLLYSRALQKATPFSQQLATHFLFNWQEDSKINQKVTFYDSPIPARRKKNITKKNLIFQEQSQAGTSLKIFPKLESKISPVSLSTESCNRSGTSLSVARITSWVIRGRRDNDVVL